MAAITTDLDDRGVYTITLDDPENRNALGVALTAELVAAMDRVDSDSDIRLALITNTGSVFCAGADLKERSAGVTGSIDPLTLFRRIQRSSKPWVGRIAGHAIAGGTGLAAAVDVSVTLDDAKFGFTEVRLGVAPAIISTICLPKMRRGEALEEFLRGRRFDGATAARLGLVNHAVSADALDSMVAEIVGDLLLGGPTALGVAKDLVYRIPTMHPDEAFPWAARRSAELFESEEAAEGMAAFLERRPPRWAPESG